MKPWDIYSYVIPGDPTKQLHPVVVLGTAERVGLKPQVNILLGQSQKANKPAQAHEALLDTADGLDWETLIRCDLVYVIEKTSLASKRGQVCLDRRRQIAAKVIQGLGLAGI